jgi:molybdopterin synthase catalytic subunit
MIEISGESIDPEALRQSLYDPGAGGFCSFEGWVRNRNDGRDVRLLEYEAYEPLAISEGLKVLDEALQRFPYLQARCVHRVGRLQIGELAVWVGVAAAHRDEAFKACRYIIDELKVRLPIWKKEFYTAGDSGWVNCERCSQHADGGR